MMFSASASRPIASQGCYQATRHLHYQTILNDEQMRLPHKRFL